MSHVLILGGGGFIGRPLAQILEDRGVGLTLAHRGGGGANGVAVDRRDRPKVQSLVRERGIDVVIDLLALVPADTLPLLALLDGEVERYVMASSGDVYRNYEGLHRKAAPEPISEPLGETSPLRDSRWPYRRAPLRDPSASDAWLDAYDKIPIEEALRGRPGLRGVILRLPMVFGPGDRNRRFRWLLQPMLAGARRLHVEARWAEWRTTYGYVDDVADALALAATHASAPGETFNLGETAASPHRTWIQRYAEALSWRGDVVETPPNADGPLAGLDLTYEMALDTSRLRRVCGWSEATPPPEALRRTFEDERDRA